MPEPEPAVQRHADHGPDVTCRPAWNGLCEPYSGPRDGLAEWRDAIADRHRLQRSGRGRRRPQEITGVVVRAPELPLDGEG